MYCRRAAVLRMGVGMETNPGVDFAGGGAFDGNWGNNLRGTRVAKQAACAGAAEGEAR